MTMFVEDPTPVIIIGIVVFAVFGAIFLSTRRAVFLLPMVGVILLTLLGVAIERFIVTDREQVETALYHLADSMEANDKNATIDCLSPSAVDTRARANWAFDNFKVEKANVSNLKIKVNPLTSPPTAIAKFQGFIQASARKGERFKGGRLIKFTLTYRKEGDRWLLLKHEEDWGSSGKL